MHIFVLGIISILVIIFVHWLAGIVLFFLGWQLFKFLQG